MAEIKHRVLTLSVPYDDDRYPPEGWDWDVMCTPGTKLLHVHMPDPLIIATVVEVDDEERGLSAGDVVLTCPHAGCDSHDFYEVDRSQRWNEMDHVEGGFFTIHQRSGEYETIGWMCQVCYGSCDLPNADEIEVTWT